MPDDASPQYYACFGEFIHRFSRVEAIINLLCRHCLGTEDATARAVIGGMSMSEMMNLAQRLVKVRNIPGITGAEINATFPQLSNIAKLRSSLVHRGALLSKDRVHIASGTYITAKATEDVEVLRLSLDDLKKATRDCETIFLRLASVARPEMKSLPSP